MSNDFFCKNTGYCYVCHIQKCNLVHTQEKHVPTWDFVADICEITAYIFNETSLKTL